MWSRWTINVFIANYVAHFLEYTESKQFKLRLIPLDV
jgi:hypothetical protein